MGPNKGRQDPGGPHEPCYQGIFGPNPVKLPMFAYQRTSLVTHKIWSITETDTTKQIHVLYAIAAYIFTNNITESICSNKNFNGSCVNGAWWVFPQRQSHILIRYRYEDNGLGTSNPLRLKRNGHNFLGSIFKLINCMKMVVFWQKFHWNLLPRKPLSQPIMAYLNYIHIHYLATLS